MAPTFIQASDFFLDLVAPVLVDVGPLPRLTNRNPVITWTVNEEAVFECALDDLKARFPLGEFVRATRSENKNSAT